MIRTVDGRPLRDDYGVVLAHEHLLVDRRFRLDTADPVTRRLAGAPVVLADLQQVREHPLACGDNLVLDDEAMATGELHRVVHHDPLVVDVTPDAWGRDPAAIARVAAAAGVDVVMGCAPGVAASGAGEGAGMPAAWYRDRILRLLEGPGPRPGVIGEIGTGDPITPDERAALSGAAMAQAATGLALYVHLEPWGRRGHEALDLVEAGGGDPGRTVLCHLDALVPGGLDEHRSLMRRGAVVAFDRWGDETRSATRRMPTDEERLEATLCLIDDGLGDLLVHGQDVRTKIQLSRFGGPGYDHIPHVVGPMLREAGLEEAEVRRQLAGNALRVLRGA